VVHSVMLLGCFEVGMLAEHDAKGSDEFCDVK